MTLQLPTMERSYTVRPDLAETPRVTETILIADDDEAIRGLTGRIVQMGGYQVLAARSVDDALELARRHIGIIHLMLADVFMPPLTSRDLAKRMNRLRPGLKTVYMSGYPKEAVVDQGLIDADDAFLHKPFRPAELLRAIREELSCVPQAQ